ncbi:MAG TPA: protoporphyrinogen oxidase [Terriglobales bacterium]|jgi:oxygen-dependent protoporphyrinogen oxidase|nr:protoporphyrinogen oxidase [Terriglobales bacterium]
MKRIAIVGGGISGLSAAFALEKHRRAGVAVEYSLFESSPRLGGVLLTESIDGCLVEAGPDSFLTEKPWAADLCREVGLADQLIGSNDRDRKTYILVNGRLVPMPDGLMFMVPTKMLPAIWSPLFSTRTKFRMMQEWFHPKRKSATDESVASFVERHYGREVVDRLADPLLSGVYGGQADNLSLRAVLPRFADMEASHGSLGRAMISALQKTPKLAAPKPLFTSLKNGMQQMADAIISHLPPSALHVNTPVQAIQRQDTSWLVSAGYASDQFDAVIISTSAPVAARLGLPAQLTSALAAIEYTSSVTVALAYNRQVRQSLPPGFGFLVPRSEGKRLLAATFVHNKFPHRAPPDRALIRCFLGGAHHPAILDQTDEEILSLAKQELRQILNLTADPLFTRIYKWNNAMAQYNVGHIERILAIEQACCDLPNLALAGNAYHGIGVPDCVRSGADAANHILQALDLPPLK